MFNLIEKLKNYKPFDERERADLKKFINFLETSDNCFDRSNLAGHVTAGALVVDQSGNILLNHHKLSGLWIQFGGHSDGQADSLEVAKREVFEEAAIKDYYCANEIFEVSVNKIPDRPQKHEPAHLHYDVNFLFVVDRHDFKISNESLDIRWVTIDEARKLASRDDASMQRMIEKYSRLLDNETRTTR